MIGTERVRAASCVGVGVAVRVGVLVFVGLSVGVDVEVEVAVGDLIWVAVGDADGVGLGLKREIPSGKPSVPPVACQRITSRLRVNNTNHATAKMLSGLFCRIHSDI